MAKLKDMLDGIASFGKVLLLSRRPFSAGKPKDERLIIMGNGPSLRDAISEYPDLLKRSKTLAVNFAANAEEFSQLKPALYVLTDPHFFNTDAEGKSPDPNVDRLWMNLSNADWDMTLYVPCRREIPESIAKIRHITIKRYNMTPGEGMRGPVHWLYRRGLAMPRPRNVLIASIMVALREGYRDILILGADHTWSRDLRVDDENRVISESGHFYKDSDKERQRVAQVYAGRHLHDVLENLTVTFRSYHQVKDFADEIGAKITNCTHGSFIDAFPRSTLENI